MTGNNFVDFSEATSNNISNYNLDEILLYDNQELSNYNPLYFLEAFNQINSSQKPDLILFGHTYETRDWVPRLSARLDIPFISDCIDVRLDDDIKFTRGLYQNKINSYSNGSFFYAV